MKPYSGHVSHEMTEWARLILSIYHQDVGAEARRWFGAFHILARVEHHTWTFRDGVKVHGAFTGVTLYDVTNETEES